MSSRPQDKNLVSFADMSPEQAREIQSAGGKASQEKRRQRKAMAELLETYSGLPIRDGRVRNRLTKLGIDPDDLTQKMLVADGIMKAAQGGNTYAIQLFLDLLGEGEGKKDKPNNLLEAIRESTREDIADDDLPEVQQAANPDADVVEQAEV